MRNMGRGNRVSFSTPSSKGVPKIPKSKSEPDPKPDNTLKNLLMNRRKSNEQPSQLDPATHKRYRTGSRQMKLNLNSSSLRWEKPKALHQDRVSHGDIKQTLQEFEDYQKFGQLDTKSSCSSSDGENFEEDFSDSHTPPKTSRGSFLVSASEDSERLEILYKVKNSKKIRKQEKLREQLSNIQHRVKMVLENFALAEAKEEAASTKQPSISNNTSIEQQKKNDHNNILYTIETCTSKSIIRQELLLELELWHKSKENLPEDFGLLSDRDMIDIIKSSQELHKGILKDIETMSNTGDRIVSLGQLLLDEMGKIRKIRRDPYKKSKTEKIVVHNEKVLHESPTKRNAAVKMVMEQMDESITNMKNNILKNSLGEAKTQYENLMSVADQQNNELKEKGRQYFELNDNILKVESQGKEQQKQLEEACHKDFKIRDEADNLKLQVNILKVESHGKEQQKQLEEACHKDFKIRDEADNLKLQVNILKVESQGKEQQKQLEEACHKDFKIRDEADNLKLQVNILKVESQGKEQQKQLEEACHKDFKIRDEADNLKLQVNILKVESQGKEQQKHLEEACHKDFKIRDEADDLKLQVNILKVESQGKEQQKQLEEACHKDFKIRDEADNLKLQVETLCERNQELKAKVAELQFKITHLETKVKIGEAPTPSLQTSKTLPTLLEPEPTVQPPSPQSAFSALQTREQVHSKSLLQLITPEEELTTCKDEASNYEKLIADLRKNLTSELDKLKNHEQREKIRHEEEMQRVHSEQMSIFKRDVHGVLCALVSFKDQLTQVLLKDNLQDVAEKLDKLGNLMAEKLSPDSRDTIGSVVSNVVDYLHSLEEIISYGFQAYKCLFQTLRASTPLTPLPVKIKPNQEETKALIKDITKQKNVIPHACADVWNMVTKLKTTKDTQQKDLREMPDIAGKKQKNVIPHACADVWNMVTKLKTTKDTQQKDLREMPDIAGKKQKNVIPHACADVWNMVTKLKTTKDTQQKDLREMPDIAGKKQKNVIPHACADVWNMVTKLKTTKDTQQKDLREMPDIAGKKQKNVIPHACSDVWNMVTKLKTTKDTQQKDLREMPDIAGKKQKNVIPHACADVWNMVTKLKTTKDTQQKDLREMPDIAGKKQKNVIPHACADVWNMVTKLKTTKDTQQKDLREMPDIAGKKQKNVIPHACSDVWNMVTKLKTTKDTQQKDLREMPDIAGKKQKNVIPHACADVWNMVTKLKTTKDTQQKDLREMPDIAGKKQKNVIPHACADVWNMVTKLKTTKDTQQKDLREMPDIAGKKQKNVIPHACSDVWNMVTKLKTTKDTQQKDLREMPDIAGKQQADLTIIELDKNLALIMKAYEENKVSKSLYKKAVTAIQRVRRMPLLKLGTLMEWYIEVKKMEQLRESYNAIIGDQNSKDNIVVDLENYILTCQKMKQQKIIEIQEKWKKIEHEKKELNARMHKIFKHLYAQTGILLIYPMLWDTNMQSKILSKSLPSIEQKTLRNMLCNRGKTKSDLFKLPEVVTGVAMPIRRSLNSSQTGTITKQVSNPVNLGEPFLPPVIMTPHIVNYQINRAHMHAIRYWKKHGCAIHQPVSVVKRDCVAFNPSA